ncbi:MAG: citrate synthase [Myxococcota bacterium]
MLNQFSTLGVRSAKSSGLDEVVFAETELSHIDGDRGELWIRGYPIEELSGHVSFEAMCALLWDGALPNAQREQQLRLELGQARVRAYRNRARWLEPALALSDPMDALRAGVALLESSGDDTRDAFEIVACVGVLLAAWSRHREGQALLEPDSQSSHASDVLRLLTGANAAERARALETYLVTVAEHGMNASTFSARVVASTQSDTVSAVTAALGALKGKLHGGAPGPVLDMLDAIGSEERAGAYLEAELAQGRRIMGMGHRIYRVRDPRAFVLERATQTLAAGLHTERVKLARSVERAASELLAERYPRRKLCANVEFFTAVLLEAVGMPRALFTATFAAARVAGYCAHIAEQRRSGRIVRPASIFVGTRRARTAEHAGNAVPG